MKIKFFEKILLLVIVLLFVSAGKLSGKLSDLETAKVYINRGKFSEGIEYLKRAKEKEGETEPILFFMGMSYFKMRKYYWAEQNLTKCVSINSTNVNAILMLYKIRDRLRKYKDAIKTLKNLSKIKPDDAVIYYFLGDEYIKLMEAEKDDDYKDDAIKNYKKAITLDTNMYEPALKIGNIYLKGKKYLQAVTYYEKVLRISPDSKTAKIGWEFCGYTANYKIAEKKFKAKKYYEAVKFYKRSIKYKPDNYKVLVRLANSYYLIAKFEEGIAILNIALELHKKPKEAHYLLGLIYYKTEKYKESEKHFKNCIRMNPKDPKPYYNLGKIKEKQEENHKAIKYFKSAISRRYKNAEYHKRLGMLSIKVSEFKEAVEELEIAENLNEKFDLSKYIDLARTLYLVHEAHSELDKENYKKALDYYEDAADIMEGMAQIYLSIGNTSIKLEKYKNAAKNLEKALQIEKNNIETYESLAFAYRKLKRFNDADRLYKNLEKLSKGNPEIYYKSGISYEERGDYQKAIKMFKKALKIDEKYLIAYERIGHSYYQEGVELYYKAKYSEAKKSFKAGLKYAKNKKLLQGGIDNCDLLLRTDKLNSLITKADRLYKSAKYREAA